VPERFLKWATKRYLVSQDYEVTFARIRLGNFEIDGEATGPKGKRTAIEIKTKRDDICRGMGQLAETLAFGYDKAILVTTFGKAKRLDRPISGEAERSGQIRRGLCGRVPHSVLVSYYTGFSLERLEEIYDQAKPELFGNIRTERVH